jgi:uncharacterized protein
MGLKEWIIPQDDKFFDLLDQMTACGVEAADLLKDLLDDFRPGSGKRQAIKDVEHRADDLVHQVYEALSKAFITPIDAEDVTKLLSGLDDFVDFIDASANRIRLYDLQETTDGMRSLGALIQRQARELQKAVAGLRALKDPAEIDRACIEIHSLENAADAILNESIASLFRGTDAIKIMKYKEVYEYLETATDKAEDAANIIGDIVMKNA